MPEMLSYDADPAFGAVAVNHQIPARANVIDGPAESAVS
jgi:hypothetical protein